MWIQEHHVSTLKLKISFQVVVNCASFPSFRQSIGEILIEGNIQLNMHGLEWWHLPQEFLAKNKEEAVA